MYLSDARYEKLKRIALDVYRRYNIVEFPIDAFEVAEKEGIKIIKYSEICGAEEVMDKEKIEKLFLEASRDAFIIMELKCIVYNDKIRSQERIQNSIMHELAHYFCNHSHYSALAEAEAKFLARYLRAPIPIICCMDFENSMQLADFFQLSEESAGYAFCNAEGLKNNEYSNVNKDLFNNIIDQFDERGEKYDFRL